MRKLVLSVALLTTVFVNAQEKIDSYNLSYWGKDYSIDATDPAKGKFSYYIDVPSVDRYKPTTSLIVKDTQLEAFKALLVKSKATFIEWSKTAKENKVTELDKEIPTDRLNLSVAFKSSKWFFDFNVGIKARFKIMTTGDYVLIVSNTDKLQASDNQYIDNDGFAIVFKSVEEIDALVNKLNVESVNKYYQSKANKDSLFKG